MSALGVSIAILYGLVLVALFAFGANGYVLVARARRHRRASPPPPDAWPDVLVQIPVFDERDVAARAVLAAGRLAYPGHLEIQVLDDSDDDTPERVAPVVAELRARGVAIEHVRRRGREGFKAGALAAALPRSRAPLVALFDADFVPHEDFLTRAVPHLGDPRVACVQGRWGHLDRDESRLTRAQALGIDVHFSIEQRARAAAGWPVSFNGSAGVWRRSALEAAGGWSADTLTEDLDLAYRAALAGYRIAYADDLECPGELPASLSAFKAQQRRWARGSTQVARKMLGRIWRAPWSLGARVQSTLHLVHYAVHPLLLASAALALPLAMTAEAAGTLWAVLTPLAMATGGPLVMSIRAGRERGLGGRALAADTACMMVLGVGLAVSNSLAVLSALSRGSGVFDRTPKGGPASSYRSRRDRLGLLEVAAGALCLLVGALLAARGTYSLVPFLALYGLGLGVVGVGSHREGMAAEGRPREDRARDAGGTVLPAESARSRTGRTASVSTGS